MKYEEAENFHLRAKLINDILLKHPCYEDLDFHTYTLDHLKEFMVLLEKKSRL